MGLNIYLNFNGDCEAAMNHYKDATNGTIHSLQRFGDSPMPVSETDKNKILHGRIEINGVTVMCSDTHEANAVTFGNNFAIALDYKNETDLNSAFNALAAGGTITMPLQDTFWGAKFGMCTDKFGVNWMLNYDMPKN